mmetsp:Transcript_22083/g.65925  ORF Transcript_22083/g.65925 Transcript_22083/m.65925 type:complete len:267 (+) Transcript_22083:795-1595(+)
MMSCPLATTWPPTYCTSCMWLAARSIAARASGWRQSFTTPWDKVTICCRLRPASMKRPGAATISFGFRWASKRRPPKKKSSDWSRAAPLFALASGVGSAPVMASTRLEMEDAPSPTDGAGLEPKDVACVGMALGLPSVRSSAATTFEATVATFPATSPMPLLKQSTSPGASFSRCRNCSTMPCIIWDERSFKAVAVESAGDIMPGVGMSATGRAGCSERKVLWKVNSRRSVGGDGWAVAAAASSHTARIRRSPIGAAGRCALGGPP